MLEKTKMESVHKPRDTKGEILMKIIKQIKLKNQYNLLLKTKRKQLVT